MQGEEESDLAFLFRTLSHDTRNMLSDASIWAEKSLSILKSGGDKKEIETAIRRIIFLLSHTKTLLTQSRKAQNFSKSLIECDDFQQHYIAEEGKYFCETAEHNIKIDWCFAATGSFFSDSHHFQRALNNLVSNAIKYGPDTGVVKIVSTNLNLDGKEFVQFAVSDQGDGILEIDLEKVFEEGYRTDSAKKSKTAGTGVGLGYVSYVADLSDGRAFVESPGRDGFATTFVIEVPKASGKEAVKALAEKSRLSKLLILNCGSDTMKFVKDTFDTHPDNKLEIATSEKSIEQENLEGYGTVIYLGDDDSAMVGKLAQKTGSIAICLDEKGQNMHIASNAEVQTYPAVPATVRMLPDMLSFELEKAMEG